MTDSLSDTDTARDRLYEEIRRDVSFEEKAERSLELGRQYLEVDNAHLTRIDRETSHWEVIVSTDPPDGQFPPGLEHDLETTYCRRTIESDAEIALHDAPQQGWGDDPAFETHGLRCYHGTRLIVDSDPFGTVCFVGKPSKPEPFGTDELLFVELISQLLERELERKRHEADLTKQANLATVLNRVVRHNLRNDLSVIRGYTQLMAGKLDGDSYGETALDHIDDLISLSQKARALDQIVATDFQREETELIDLVERTVREVTQADTTASVEVEADERIVAPVSPDLQRALEELIENAVKHAGEDPSVTVTIGTVSDDVEILIEDDGPGLSEDEAEVLETGSETPLTHGSGLGLWLAHWIVTNHSGSIDATVTDRGTSMTVTIPRKQPATVQEKLTELLRARDQYQAAFEEAPDGMIIVNDDARIVDANAEAGTIYGLEQNELLGREIGEFLPDEVNFEADWEEFRTRSVDRDTVTIAADDGTERSVEYAATAEIIPDYHLVIIRDNTESRARLRTRSE